MASNYDISVAFSKPEAGIEDFTTDLLRHLLGVRETSEVA